MAKSKDDKNKKKGQPEEPFVETQVKATEIVEIMKDSYIDYAMSVIVARALPDVRDGLKPAQRRILYVMLEEGLRHNAKYRKSATVVGSTLGRYHPHGDMAVYETMVRLAQDFTLRYPLVQGQGNFGSIDGDPAAAQRYTECRLSKVGEETLRDIEKNTVNFIDNYDGTRKEPSVLPSPVPQLLLNGSLGIAVGMATNIPPHNLGEVCDALTYLLDNPKATTEDLFEFVKGPDFPLGGEIFDKKSIIQVYSQGKGPIVCRGKAEIVNLEKNDRYQILITEIPYQVQKSNLLEQIANLVAEKRIEGVKDVRDESDKEGMRIAIDLHRDGHPQKILNRLYKFTDLQRTFHLNMLALVDGIQPEVMNLADALNYFLAHRKEVVIRRIQFELDKAKERAHILEGLVKCLADIDEVIRIIRKSENRDDARVNLMKRFKLDEVQANAILETKLAALAKLERKKIEDELKQLMAMIEDWSATLKSPARIKTVMKKELAEVKLNFGDDRRTKVHAGGIGEISEEDLIPEEETIITLTNSGYIKRIDPKTYKIQKRGGKGIIGLKTVGDDIVEQSLIANTHDRILFFTDSGRVFQTLAYEIPEGARVAKGRAVVNFLEMSPQEKVLYMMPLDKKADPKAKAKQKEEKPVAEKYLLIITKNGIAKKASLDDFDNIRRSGLIAITLKKDDSLRKVSKTTGDDEVLIVTKKGQSVRFKESQIRPMGRQAAGIKAIGLKRGDEVVGMDVIPSKANEASGEKKKDRLILVVMENGYGKKTSLKEYRLQNRGGSGIKTAQITSKTGELVTSFVLSDEEELMIISKKGQVIRIPINGISTLSRPTQGVRIMRLETGDKVASASCI
ncbi:MAG TPA: DNA gyrase subunit A [Candidatus Paceibacterota bacterium]|nr:DNA gyrase subunit A [Candidatus Pacearchaeota archaeon]HRZ51035.1 DNA gyrase subunit A [Candidatus Paceibacterota bacterium]HSA36806.1 DNA gyrase subunit A [Candidatus Paceibacterota bacterium]